MNGDAAVALLACYFLTLDSCGLVEKRSLGRKSSARALRMLPHYWREQRGCGGLPCSQRLPIVPGGLRVPWDLPPLVSRDCQIPHTLLWKLTLCSGNFQPSVSLFWGLTLVPEFWNAVLTVGQC